MINRNLKHWNLQVCALIWLLSIPFAGIGQITKPGYQKPKKPIAAEPNPTPKKFTGNCTLIIELDADGVLFVDYEKIWNYKKGEYWKSQIQSGEHLVKLVNGEDEWVETIYIKSGQVIIKTDLRSVIAEKTRLRLEEERRKTKEKKGARENLGRRTSKVDFTVFELS